jgi:hypothetical protein
LAPLRRAGTRATSHWTRDQQRTTPQARRHSTSKTRVNALMAPHPETGRFSRIAISVNEKLAMFGP